MSGVTVVGLRVRCAVLVVAGPEAALLAYVCAILIVGFPVSLLLLPVFGPLLVVVGVQVRAAARTWRGSSDAARLLRAWCLLIGVVLASGLAVLAARSRDGAVETKESQASHALYTDVAWVLAAVNLVAGVLLLGPHSDDASSESE